MSMPFKKMSLWSRSLWSWSKMGVWFMGEKPKEENAVWGGRDERRRRGRGREREKRAHMLAEIC